MMTFKKLSMLPIFAFVLLGCSSFHGVRQPLYDGTPIVADEEAIEVYRASREIIGEEKEYYFRYPFSQEIFEESLPYPNEAPLLLEEGRYMIGEDVPAGRVSLLSNESVFTGENTVIHVGNLIIYDEEGEIYFENLFHSDYGQTCAQVDFRPGHTIEIIGERPEITVFYTKSYPENPYLLMEPPQVLINLDRLAVQDPVVEKGETVALTAGIFEVGVHLEADTYAIQFVDAPHHTELFLFREGEAPRVFELLITPEMEKDEKQAKDKPVIELQAGDKIYPNLVRSLVLTRIEEL